MVYFVVFLTISKIDQNWMFQLRKKGKLSTLNPILSTSDENVVFYVKKLFNSFAKSMWQYFPFSSYLLCILIGVWSNVLEWRGNSA